MRPQACRSNSRARRVAFGTLAAIGFSTALNAQNFDAGSLGTLGDVIIATNTTITLPEDGKLHFKSLVVSNGATLTFSRNSRNTPVFVLSQNEVVVNGTINVDGGGRSSNTGGLGGPGAFDGGKPGFGAEVPPGFGYGPGGGAAGGNTGCSGADRPVPAAHATTGFGSVNTNLYGSPLLIPVVGGSGGGGGQGTLSGGGGGGGAILIAANNRVAVSGSILARGGFGGNCDNAGSGGSIRLVSFKVEGGGTLDATGGSTPNRGFGTGGDGRIRVDTVIRTGVSLTMNGVSTIGGNLLVFPPTVPTLTVTEAAGNAVTNGSGPVTFTLPFGSTTNRTIKIQARDFGRSVPIRVALTPDSGSPRFFDAVVDNPGPTPQTVDVPVTVPVNTLVTVHCWTR